MKIAYCGYDFFHACLQELLHRGFDVGKVFTVDTDNQFNFNQYVKEIGEQWSIPVTQQRIRAQDLAELAAQGYELVITAGYYHKVPDLAPHGLKGINVHPTLLPMGRGVWPLPWTILLDRRQSGVTIHKLTQEFDAGDILHQQAFEVTPQENLESLSAKVQLLAQTLLADVLAEFDRCWSQAYAQVGEVQCWPRPSLEDRTLDWKKSVAELDRISRAFGKYGCLALFDNQQWVVYVLSAWRQEHGHIPGIVVHKTNTEMVIAAADGLVSLRYFQPWRE